MTVKPLDVLVFIPLLPAIPVAITWFLPWERWVPKKVPNRVIGPYLLYCSFAESYFGVPWWSVALVGLWGLAVCGVAVAEASAKPKD